MQYVLQPFAKVISISAEHYQFNDFDQLYETADELPEVDRHEVYAYHEDMDEWEQVPYKDSLWTEDGRATGVVSSSEDFYHVTQYGDILETVGKAVEQYQDTGIEP
ncbi:hypothetical protein [Haloarcula sp. JP-L23]|uniref:hypothetical protein n=1 Tax=Haloarcula sp. JP-L23 TaxID=2716717 RepID=UPI001D05834B